MELQTFFYDNKIVKQFAFATVLWGVVGLIVGLLIALQLAAPIHNMGIEYLTYGRARPIHTNAIIFAFVGNAIFMGVYYSMQRLLKARMYSDVLSKIHFWGWQLIIVLAAVTLALGFTTGKEYAELEWPIDILIAVVWVVFAWNMFGTIAKRRVKHLYVAIWFYVASVLAIAILHIVNSVEIPAGLFKSYPVYAGVQDALVQWWYGHNAVGFFLTTPFLGLMYYFLPKMANRPVFSYRLSIIHFWALIFIYIWTGPHHLLYQAMPDWIQSLGVVFSIMLLMPSWGGMINGLLTLRGVWDKVRESAELKFMVVAVTAYGMSTFEGPLLSVKFINAFSHFTDWTVAHAHIGALGWNGFMIFAILYWLIPKLFNTKLYSPKMANVHFWIGTLSILFWSVPMYWAAFAQGLNTSEFTADGFLKYDTFMKTIQGIIPMYFTRAFGGLIYIVGVVLMVINLIKTAKSGVMVANEEVTAPPLPVTAKRNPMVETIHKWLERRPFQLTVMMFIALIIGGMVQIIPIMIVESNIPTIASVKPYTPLELHGRDIYVKEGCYTCHSQVVRALRAETERYGEYSKPGEFVYDHPFQWGSKRTGPDLARAGVVSGKMYKNAAWHYRHFINPQEMNEKSNMPAYKWLINKDVNLASTSSKILAMRAIGVPYAEGYEKIANNDYMLQAAKIVDELKLSGITVEPQKEVVALIAYLHRLGRDITVVDSAAMPVQVKVPELLTDKVSLDAGMTVFKANCVACHGQNGEGNIVGPNLTDNYYLVGNSNEDIYKSIYNGNPVKGMQPYKNQLNEKDLQAVYSYVLSLQGSNPPNAKAAQGNLIDKK